jgi:type II secretory pathway pseudopilin PulG
MTLVELMIASGIVTIALVLTLGSIISVSSTTDLAEDRAMAAATITSVLEELRALPYQELLAYQPPVVAGTGVGTVLSVACIASDGTAVPLPVDSSSFSGSFPNPVEVRVTVTWRDKMGRPYSLRNAAFLVR